MENGDPITAYRQFLENFSNKIDNLSPDESQIPFRLSGFCLTPSEVEAECLEWTRRYLSMNDCPVGLLPQLSRAVYNNFHSSINLADFYLESEDVDNGNASDASSDDDDDDTFGHSNFIQLSSHKLLQEVVSFVHSTIKTWRVVPPVLHHPPTKFHVCSHAIKNTRRKMEDRHVIISDFNALFDLKDSPNQSYFAVFDGHGGLEAAEYAATHLHCHLVADDKFAVDPAQAMKQAYKATDVRFLEKAKREGVRSGTTGVSVFIREGKMYVGWLGDSQALLVRGGQPIQIMNPHKPEREDERQRIEDLGGCVLFIGAWRVNGNISVSRAIGDLPHKPFISSDADATTVLMTGEEEYLVLACDGLWDVLSPSRVTQIVYKHSISSTSGLDDAAMGLVNAARDVGSSDNISVIVVLFKSNLSKPQATEDSDLLLSFKDVSSVNSDQMPSSSHATSSKSNNPTEIKMNERLKSKNSGGEVADREFLENLSAFINGSTGNHSTMKIAQASSSSLSKSAAKTSSNSSTNLGSSSTSSYHSSSNGQATAPLSSSIHDTPFSHELMRQALFYICKDRPPRREDSQLVALALSQAMKGDKQGQRKKGGVSEKGRYARQGSASTSPRRPSVRPLSRASQVGTSRKSTSLRGGTKKKPRPKRKSGNALGHVRETMWTSDEDDTLSIKSQNLGVHGGHLGPMETSGSGGLATWPSPASNTGHHSSSNRQLQSSWRVEPNSLQGHVSTVNRFGGATSSNLSRNLPTLLGRSVPLGNRSVLPGIESSKYLSNSSEDVSQLSNKHRTGIGTKKNRGANPQTARPAYGRGYSVLSDSYAMRQNSKGLNGAEDFRFETASQNGDSSAAKTRSYNSIPGLDLLK